MKTTVWEVVEVDLNNIKILSDGPLPLLAAVYDQLNIGSIVDELVEWDREKCFLSPGQATKALVLNILTDRKPLYRMVEFYADKDVEKLIGKGINHSLGYNVQELSGRVQCRGKCSPGAKNHRDYLWV